MIELKIYDKKLRVKQILFPERWDELSREQLERVAVCLFFAKTDVDLKFDLFRILTGFRNRYVRKIGAKTIVEQFFPLLDFLLDDVDLRVQKIPKLKVGNEVLWGPSDGFGNLRLNEFDFSERAYFDFYEEDRRLDFLAEIIAVIYRPAKDGYDFDRNPDGDARLDFNANLIEYYAKKIEQYVPVSVQLSILLWYRGCRNEKVNDNKALFSNLGKNKVGEPGYFDLMRAIAKEGIYGDFEKVERMYVDNAFYELMIARKEVEELKKLRK